MFYSKSGFKVVYTFDIVYFKYVSYQYEIMPLSGTQHQMAFMDPNYFILAGADLMRVIYEYCGYLCHVCLTI